ncbi:MAG: DUF748 domain-containing protein [Rhodocyclaceae bacterium]|nr:DUF748 domain-containing protein [Rhodocyclaceae bacterium]
MSESVKDRLLKNPYAQKAAARVKRHRRWLYACVGLVALFGLVGYFWLPGFAKGKAEALLSEKLHRPVTIQRVEFHPYSLEAAVEGLRIGEREGDGELLGFDRLYVNLSSASFYRRAPVISAIKLTGPRVHLVRNADGTLNISDLIEEFSKQPKSEEPARFSVSNIEVEGGRITLDDRLKHGQQTVSDIKLGLPFIASFESAEEVWVVPHLSARLNDKAQLLFEGKARPFADRREMVMDVSIQDLDLTGVDQYAPPLKGIKLLSGLLDTKLDVSFVQAADAGAAIRINGDVVLRNLGVDNQAGLPWRLAGERLAVHLVDFDPFLKQPLKAAVQAANLRLVQGARPELKIDALSLADVVADFGASNAQFALDSTINGKGHLRAKGKAAWAPLSADVDVDAEQVDFVALQGWALEKFDRPSLALTKGALSFVGKVKAGGQPLNVALSGKAGISDFNLLDKATSEDLLRWRSLDVTGIDVNTQPLNVKIDSVVQSDLFARVTIMPDGSIRLRDALLHGEESEAERQAEAAGKEVEKSRGGTVAKTELPEKRQALPIRVGEVVLKNGNVIFNDRFIKPNYRANLTKLNGKLGPLAPGQRGQVEIAGAVNRSAPLEIKGKVDPFGSELFIDLSAKAKGIDLPGFSPYSSRYIGYQIAKGKLSVDLRYFIEKGELRAENNIFLDQFTLGEKVDSPNAISLPVGLAVSLLKNSRGEIDINLPISGSLNDPEFSIGGLIVKVFFNLLTKAVTAPFALLGNLFGGGADLSYVEFAPGYARLTPEAEKSLDAIGKVMADRPALKMEITGIATTATDRDGLRKATLERRVKAQKLADLARQGKSGGSINDVEVSAAEYSKYLEQAYKAEKFDKPRNLIGMAKSLPVPEMEQLMLANMPAGDEELRGLAERRARSAYDALIAKGVPGERVFVVQPRIDAAAEDKKPGGRADFSLR